MSRLLFFIFIIHFFSCQSNDQQESHYSRQFQATFHEILNHHDLYGAILIYNRQKNVYHSNDFEWSNQGFLPASTFKIPNSIIALETGVMKSDTTVITWDGDKRAFESWEKDLTLRDAFRVSCVPCYQEIARNIGLEKMQAQLKKLGYPTMDIDSTTLDNFWLTGSSRITLFEQIDFIRRLYEKQLPIPDTTYYKMLRIFEIEKSDDYTLYGKTGWFVDEQKNNGWFVGFLVKNDNTYYFAANVQPKNPEDTHKFVPGREQAIRDALQKMEIL